jgi:diguanylate cyclase (GGDEF)-like protein
MIMAGHPEDTCPVDHPECGILAALRELRDENGRLATQVRTDPLTGLFNYRHFRESLQAELERTGRSGQPTALIIVDLDHFKQVNDRWGHEVGNLALRHAAECMRATMRRIDILCRYGGEEFTIIVPATGLAGAVKAAERLRRMLEASPLETGRGTLQLTASLGVAIHTSLHPLTTEAMVKQADAFMYEAKQAGRNRVCHPPLESAAASQVTTDERAALLG